jgi:hypothetical protein
VKSRSCFDLYAKKEKIVHKVELKLIIREGQRNSAATLSTEAIAIGFCTGPGIFQEKMIHPNGYIVVLRSVL